MMARTEKEANDSMFAAAWNQGRGKPAWERPSRVECDAARDEAWMWLGAGLTLALWVAGVGFVYWIMH